MAGQRQWRSRELLSNFAMAQEPAAYQLPFVTGIAERKKVRPVAHEMVIEGEAIGSGRGTKLHILRCPILPLAERHSFCIGSPHWPSFLLLQIQRQLRFD